MSDELALLRRARMLEDLSDLAEDVTRILGGARAAGLDPAALGGLVGAAYALGASPVVVFAAGRGRRSGYPTEREFIADLTAAEDDITDRLRQFAMTHAAAALAAALEALDEAQNMRVCEPCNGCHADRDAAIAAAELRVTICEQVVGIADRTVVRLKYALKRLRAVPADLGEVYESVYNLIRSGGRMPHKGRWVTGEGDAVPASPHPATARRQP